MGDSGRMVSVFARVRPPLPREIVNDVFTRCLGVPQGNPSSTVVVTKTDAPVLLNIGEVAAKNSGLKTFSLDEVLEETASNADVYKSTLQSLVSGVTRDGVNGCLFCYGQSGSGKTHTVQGDGADPGLLLRAAKDILAVEGNSNLSMSYLQIYGRDLSDLLLPSNTTTSTSFSHLRVRESPDGEVFVEGLSRWAVKDLLAVQSLLTAGHERRAVTCTNLNATSSRSHAIVTFFFEKKHNSSGNDEDDHGEGSVAAKLNLVDLAGSERVKDSGVEGQSLKEACQINLSLFNLARVVKALSAKGNDKGGSSLGGGGGGGGDAAPAAGEGGVDKSGSVFQKKVSPEELKLTLRLWLDRLRAECGDLQTRVDNKPPEKRGGGRKRAGSGGVEKGGGGGRPSSSSSPPATKKKRVYGKSDFRGVFQSDTSKWTARLTVAGKKISLGPFFDEESAARAYDDAAAIHFQSKAKFNFSRQPPDAAAPPTVGKEGTEGAGNEEVGCTGGGSGGGRSLARASEDDLASSSASPHVAQGGVKRPETKAGSAAAAAAAAALSPSEDGVAGGMVDDEDGVDEDEKGQEEAGQDNDVIEDGDDGGDDEDDDDDDDGNEEDNGNDDEDDCDNDNANDNTKEGQPRGGDDEEDDEDDDDENDDDGDGDDGDGSSGDDNDRDGSDDDDRDAERKVEEMRDDDGGDDNDGDDDNEEDEQGDEGEEGEENDEGEGGEEEEEEEEEDDDGHEGQEQDGENPGKD
mmetsp:Transcript_34983/g.69516  ORF Transcript_34983/g.69516 Transcript_34983/m.69516 type:complete len:744 (+) Transcript_34983:63-2294(+)